MSDIVLAGRKKVRIMLDEFSIQKEEKKESSEELISRIAESEYNRGYQECKNELEDEYLQKSEREIAELKEINNSVISDINEQLDRLETELPEMVLNLSLLIAEKIIHSRIELDGNIREQIETALKKVTGASDITVKINTQDLELVNGQFNHVKFVADENIDRGGCLVETEIGNVDARVSSQLEEIKRTVETILSEQQ